ncbi:MAG: hydrogenase iron-sulfur subunit [Nitrospira sp.]|nr:hydrogenase iron-sulfur subunit [Nitrospira sp.]
MNDKAVPPCQAACPIHTDVRGYVSAIAKGDVEEAIRIIRQVNPFPSSCGRICTRLCEKACRRAQIDEPISIRELKRFASDQTLGLKLIEIPENSYEEKIAVIGSGPAGLTAAHDLALLGYRVTVFDSQHVLGGMLSQGIPDYRLPKDLVKKEVDNILALGVEAKTGLSLGQDFTLEELLKDYQAVFIAVGSQKSLLPKYNGVELNGVIAAVEFLKQVSRGHKPRLGKNIAVIGGGHTAIDAARTSVRLGASDVTIVYRRTVDEIPAGPEEVEHAEKEGIKIIYLAAPVEFSGNEKVQSVRFIKMQLGDLDKSGRRRPVPIENSEFEITADTVILAIGYMPDAEVLKESGLNISRSGTVLVKDYTGITNIHDVFAAGDVVSGPQSVIEAIASGRRVAEALHHYFRTMPDKEEKNFMALKELDDGIVKLINKSERQKMPALKVEERITNFDEVDLGYSKDQAVMEAQRCLNCGAGAVVADNCAACLNCVRICPYGIPFPGKEIAEIDISQCQACGICASECPASAIILQLEAKENNRAELEKAVDIAREETPEILIIGFYCRYGSPIGPPFDEDEVCWLGKFCTGRMDEHQFIYPFELEVDGVVIHMCKNDECRFRDGNQWSKSHIKSAKKILNEIGIGADRLDIISEEDFHNFRNKLHALGINPLRTGKKVKT